MRQLIIFWLAAFAATALASVAHADHRHHRHWRPGGYHSYYRSPGIGFYFGSPWYPRPYFAYPYYPYFPPAVVTVPANPPVYIERDPPPTNQQLPSGYWYYCDNPQGYYPYVNECPQGWRQVDPVPQR